jgi:hypothetical protein
VCGLACLCCVRRSVKKRCRMSQNWAPLSSCALPVFLEAVYGLPHQLREGGEVPIGITHVDMAKVGLQDGET